MKQGDAPDALMTLFHSYMEKVNTRPDSDDAPADDAGERSPWAMFRDSPKPALRLDEANRIIEMNDAFATLCKVSRDEVTGRSMHSVLNLREELQMAERPFAAQQGPVYEELTISCERDDRKTFVLRIERFPDAVRKEIYLLVSDITEQRRFAETLTQDSVRGEIFVDIVNSLWADFMNYEKTLDVLTNKIAQHIGGSCIIHLLMDTADIIEHVAINHSNPKAMVLFQDLLYATRWHAAEGLPEEVVSAGNALLIPNVTKGNLAMLGSPQFADCISALQTRSLLMMPMYHSERIMGTMTLLRSGTDQPYTNKDKSFVQRIANVGAMAITNAQRMRKCNSELLSKLRSARNEVRHTQVLEAVVQALDLLKQQEPTPDLFEEILLSLGEALAAESAFIALAGHTPGTFSIVAEWSNGDFPPALKAKFEGDIFLPRIWTTPLEAGVLLHRTHDSFTGREKDFFADADLLSIAVVPVLEQGRLKAILAFENCSSDEDCLERNESALKTFVAYAAAGMFALQHPHPPAPAKKPCK